MIFIPINDEKREKTLVMLIIEKNNLERMKAGDPITIESVSDGGVLLKKVKYPGNMSWMIAYSEDDRVLYRLARNGDLAGIATHIQRNRKWVPEEDGRNNIVSLHHQGGDN